jgi:hypothetical protein
MKTKHKYTFRDSDVIEMFHTLECASKLLAEQGDHYCINAFSQIKRNILRNRMKDGIKLSKKKYKL